MDKLDEFHGKYPNIKIIITTRLEADLLSKHKIKVDIYVRCKEVDDNNTIYIYYLDGAIN